MLRRGLESPYAERLEEWKPDPAHDARITTRVPCGEYFPIRDQALLAHATQIDPDGPWFHVPAGRPPGGLADRGLRAARRSFVDTELPEDDLFAGIRGRADLVA